MFEVLKKIVINMNVKYLVDVVIYLLDWFNVLLLGVDIGEFGRIEKGRLDLMIVVYVNFKNEIVKFISLE